MILGVAPELWASLATVTGIWLVTVISPGPNFVATAHAAVTDSRRAGLLVTAGIALGTTIWAAASLLGLALLFETAGWLYQAVRIAGAAYLVFVGLRMILTARSTALATPGAVRPRGALAAFRHGLLTDLSNPKAAAFFTSLFAVAVPPTAPLWFALAIITLVVVIAAGWYGLVAWVIATGPVAAAYRRLRHLIAYLTGTLFVGFGLRLAAER